MKLIATGVISVLAMTLSTISEKVSKKCKSAFIIPYLLGMFTGWITYMVYCVILECLG